MAECSDAEREYLDWLMSSPDDRSGRSGRYLLAKARCERITAKMPEFVGEIQEIAKSQARLEIREKQLRALIENQGALGRDFGDVWNCLTGAPEEEWD